MIKVNEKTIPFQEGTRVKDLAESFKPGADVFIVNGFPVVTDTVLADNDVCCLVRRAETPSQEEKD